MNNFIELDERQQQLANDYSRRSNTYDEEDFHPQLVHSLIEYAGIQRGQKILDIATGTGLVANWALAIGHGACICESSPCAMPHAPCPMRHAINVRTQYDCCHRTPVLTLQHCLNFAVGGLTVACESDIIYQLSHRLPDFTAGEQMWLNCFQSFRPTDKWAGGHA